MPIFANCLQYLRRKLDRIESDGVRGWCNTTRYVAGPSRTRWDVGPVGCLVICGGKDGRLMMVQGIGFGVSRLVLLLKTDKSLNVAIAIAQSHWWREGWGL